MVSAVLSAPPDSWGAAARDAARRLRHVHLSGGGATQAAVEAIARLGFECTASADPVFAAARAGMRELGPEACCDLGQTSLKVVEGESAVRVERDWKSAPHRDALPPGAYPNACRSTLEFLSRALAIVRSRKRILLALPCEFTRADWPQGSTYCWGDPDQNFVEALEERLGLQSGAVDYLNDAELAGLAARADAQVPRGPPVLVLTIGFGVGGALLT
jgi:hypothetical protein